MPGIVFGDATDVSFVPNTNYIVLIVNTANTSSWTLINYKYSPLLGNNSISVLVSDIIRYTYSSAGDVMLSFLLGNDPMKVHTSFILCLTCVCGAFFNLNNT